MPEVPRPTQEQVKHYEKVVKPRIEKAVKKLSTKQLEKAVERDGEIAIAELARRRRRLPTVEGIEPTIVGVEPITPPTPATIRGERQEAWQKAMMPTVKELGLKSPYDLSAVDPKYAEQHPEAVIKIGDYYYRPRVLVKHISRKPGETTEEYIARRDAPEARAVETVRRLKAKKKYKDELEILEKHKDKGDYNITEAVVAGVSAETLDKFFGKQAMKKYWKSMPPEVAEKARTLQEKQFHEWLRAHPDIAEKARLEQEKLWLRAHPDIIEKSRIEQEKRYELYKQLIKALEPFRLKEPTARYEYPEGGAPFEYYEGLEQYDLAAALRKGIDPDGLKQIFPPEIVKEAQKFNKEMEQAAKTEELYQATMWRNLRTHEIITGAERKAIIRKNPEMQDWIVKEQPALILPLDPKWQELKNRPKSDPERRAYVAKWQDKAIDAVAFASLAATPYTLGGLSVLGAALTIPKIGLRAIPAIVWNPIVKTAVSIGSLVATLAPPAIIASRIVDEDRTAQLQTDWQKFEQLSSAEKNKWADKSGYPANYNKLTDEQKSVVLLNYSVPPGTSREQWAQTIFTNLNEMQFFASQKSGWLQHHAPAPIARTVSIAGGAVVGVLEGLGYTASLPLIAGMLGTHAIKGTALSFGKEVITGMTQFFTQVLPAAVRANPYLASGRITGLFLLSPAAIYKLGKGGIARFSPRYVPERAMAMEMSTVRIRFDNVGEFLKLSAKKRMSVTENAIKELLAGKDTVKIPGGKVEIIIKNVPYQKIVGDTLWHFTTDIKAFNKGQISVKGKVFTSPQAALRFGLMTSKGKLGSHAGLVEIRVPKDFKPKMVKLLSKGEAELESVFGKDIILDPIPGWTGKGISANVYTGSYPIRRFTIAGTKTIVKPLTPARLAEIRLAAGKEAFIDMFLGWTTRNQIAKSIFLKDPAVAKIEKSITQLKKAKPEIIGEHGEIVNPRQSIPHPSGRGKIKPRVTAVVRNSKGEIMLVKDVTEQSFGLPGGQINIKWQKGQLGFKVLPSGRRILTHEGAAHGQVKSETGIGLDKTRYLDTYMGKLNDYALSGSRIYEALAKTDIFKLKKSEIKDALWWDGKSEVTVYPATFDILKGLAKKYNLDMSKVKIDKSRPILNKARDTAIANRLLKNNPITEVKIAELNRVEIKALEKQMYDIAKGRQPELADWLLAEGELERLAELIHGRRKATKLGLSTEVEAQIDTLLKQAKEAKTIKEALRLRKQAEQLEAQAKAELKVGEKQLAEVYDRYGRYGYRDSMFKGRYAHWLDRLIKARPPTKPNGKRYPLPEELAREHLIAELRERPRPVTPEEYRLIPPEYREIIVPPEYRPPIGRIQLERVPPTKKIPPKRVPPLRVPPKRVPPLRVPPERVPPPKKPPTEVPPVKPPPPVILGLVATREERRKYEGAVCWAQGQLKRKDGKLVTQYKVWKYPYRQEDLEHFAEGEVPSGVKILPDISSAYATIQQFRGKVAPRETQEADIGAFIARVSKPTAKPGGKGEIRFTKDIKNVKRAVKLKRKKVKTRKAFKSMPELTAMRL